MKTEAQKQLESARQYLTKITQDEEAVRERQQKLLGIVQQRDVLQTQIKEAEAVHAAALGQWADDGASGDAPKPPASIATLTRKLESAKSTAAAAEQAAEGQQAQIDAAAQASAQALRGVKIARRACLVEIIKPLIVRLREARSQQLSIAEHLGGLTQVTRELTDEVPGIASISSEIATALRFAPQLTPGGAEASREAWIKLVAALFDDATAQIGAAPATFDPDQHLRKNQEF